MPAPHGTGRKLRAFTGGFLAHRSIARMMTGAGYPVSFGWPTHGQGVAVWGRRPVAWRGRLVARLAGAPLVTVEDAFLRSVLPGRAGAPPLGLLIDHAGVHFDHRYPSDLETLLQSGTCETPALLARARDGIARLRDERLSKYNASPPDASVPKPGYVLVVDQTRGDASVGEPGFGPDDFAAMLQAAREENPGKRILIRAHPETRDGLRKGYFGPTDAVEGQVALWYAPTDPWTMLEGADAVYCLSSQLGFEAILAGHRPHVFGGPFYAGWGLTQDRQSFPRRTRRLAAEALFAAAMLEFPHWADPGTGTPIDFEQAADILAARRRAWVEDRRGQIATGMRLWKRKPLRGFLAGPVRFQDPALRAVEAAEPGQRVLSWGVSADATAEQAAAHKGVALVRVEDGFLRSRGLGAELVPPLSLTFDDLGIYYDPTRPSRLETLIAASSNLAPRDLARARALIDALVASGVTKYNLGAGDVPVPPDGRKVVLVPGQVEDDASIRLGCGDIRTNLDLLRAARAGNPDACLIYKPHPDVEAGLRPGLIPDDQLNGLADDVARKADPAALLAHADAVWTMTSLMGFEALLRGVPVTCLGAPFYAGWGLTDDRGPVPARRSSGVTLEGLAHAALIAYPRYVDPLDGLATTPEVVLQRLADGRVAHPGATNRLLSKAQGLLASRAQWWR